MMNNLSTFKDLYIYLQSIDNLDKLFNYNFKHIEIQESLLRIFAKLKCIKEFKNFSICKGNFNLQEIEKIINYNDIFYYNNELIKLKDNGDISDLTLISNLTATASCNFSLIYLILSSKLYGNLYTG